MSKSGDIFYMLTASRREKLTLGKELGQGANGTVFLDAHDPTRAIKIYQDSKLRGDYSPKVQAMLEIRPNLDPITLGGRQYVQLAWPTAMVELRNGRFAGFTMPVVDFRQSRSLEDMLQAKVRQKLKLPGHLRHRVALAANLASVMAALHAVGHYMIDMKPTNIRIYPETMYLAVLDCDGFNIRLGNGHRMPAAQFSQDYIAPEVGNSGPEKLGEAQDLFALAVIIFRLLNNGLHPFQGRMPKGSPDPGTLQERINAKLYAYGIQPYSVQTPAPQSIHTYLDDDTRQLFDRAFSSTSRPSADEWGKHLNSLRSPSRLRKCTSQPNEHDHFSKGCPFCKTAPPSPTPPLQQPSFSNKPAAQTSGSFASAAPGPPPPQIQAPGDGGKYLLPISLAILFIFTVASVLKAPTTPFGNSTTTKPPVTGTQTSPIPPQHLPAPTPSKPQAQTPPSSPAAPPPLGSNTATATPPITSPKPTPGASLAPQKTLPLSTIAGPVDDVLDTANIVVGGRIVRLDGIRGFDGKYVTLMKNYIRGLGASVTCHHAFGDKYKCRLPNGVDLGKAAVFNGAAWTLPGGPADYNEAEAEARNRKKGVWSSQ
ncbi:protein kinase domain-containing protein [Ferrovibrio sp.]|uniref:protein kinase domain-containing protein n=1 Tax=Ferrovibrio sp. TaxID=1917215 RepID=UPI003D2B39CF